MFNVLIDTCVWLDLADKPQQTALMSPLEGLLSYGGINILVPRIVLEGSSEIGLESPRRAPKA